MIRPFAIIALVLAAGFGAGCSSDSSSLLGGVLTTQAIAPAQQSAATPTSAPRVDPVCAALAARIDSLRQDGVTERAEKAAATGKSTTVQVKRASLGQLADLDKANAEFQAKCSTVPRPPVQQQAAAANVVTPVAATAAPKPAAAAPVAAAPVAVAPAVAPVVVPKAQ